MEQQQHLFVQGKNYVQAAANRDSLRILRSAFFCPTFVPITHYNLERGQRAAMRRALTSADIRGDLGTQRGGARRMQRRESE